MFRAILSSVLAIGLVIQALPSPLRAASREPVRAKHAMAVAQQPAELAGLQVLQRGGNAVDAAVAIGFALAVTYPFAGNLGGGGFMLIRLADGRSTFIDFRETAPAKSTPDMYLDAQGNPTRDSLEGWRSSGVPGTVRGFELAQSKYGKLKWADDMAPAIELATKGFPVSYSLAESLKGSRGLGRDPESKRIFQRDGRFYEMGETITQPDLAKTMTRIAQRGAKEFYEGDTAKALAEQMAKHGGLITLDDLKNYKAEERQPLSGAYKGYTVIAAPPPSSGGVGILQMLAMLDGTGYEKSGFGSAAAMHMEAEVMRRFYADRNNYLGDPAFVKNPIAGLLEPAYVTSRRASIDLKKASNSDVIGPGPVAGSGESNETTHYNVIDAEGNAVAVTYTLNGGYGNGITVPGLGFLLNNEMDDFASKPGSPNLFGLVQGKANDIRPGKRPLSSMSPTIILKNGKPFMLVGSPGGSHISTAVLQVILNVIDFGMNVQEAIDAPRLHHQWKPDKLFVEKGFSPDTLNILRSMGHDVSFEPGAVASVVEAIVADGEWLQGGSDGRRNGRASGY